MVMGTTSGPGSESCLDSTSCHRNKKSLDPIIVLMALNKPRKATSRYWRHVLVEFGENWHWKFSATGEVVFLVVFHTFLLV